MSLFVADQYECGCSLEESEVFDFVWMTCSLHDQPVAFLEADGEVERRPKWRPESPLVDLRGERDWMFQADERLAGRLMQVYQMGMSVPLPEPKEFTQALIDLRESINETLHEAPSHDGASELHQWWGLSYSAFLTMPRLLMQEMPDDWQRRMADLLYEYYATYPNRPPVDTKIRLEDPETGEDVRDDLDWLLDYRRPSQETREKIRKLKDWDEDWEDEF